MSIRLQGTLTDGLGRGRDFITLEGYARQFESELGYRPFPGTLNLEIHRTERSELRRITRPKVIEPWSDGETEYGGVDCYPATMTTPTTDTLVEGHVIWPHRTDHDTKIFELIAPVKLRDALDIEDGDRVLVVDDLLSTGGTLAAVCERLEEVGADIADIVVVFRKVGPSAIDDTDYDVTSLVDITVDETGVTIH
jgi:bifunctional DNA-binding transcriptional regulator/antitoxin component of YhaV-PrlF toxin-antitoxin module